MLDLVDLLLLTLQLFLFDVDFLGQQRRLQFEVLLLLLSIVKLRLLHSDRYLGPRVLELILGWETLLPDAFDVVIVRWADLLQVHQPLQRCDP